MGAGYWWITVDKRPGSGGAHVLVAAPHYSLLDAFFGYYEAPSAISKVAVKHIPIIGTLAMAVQTIFVDRKDPEARSGGGGAWERGAAGAAAGGCRCSSS